MLLGVLLFGLGFLACGVLANRKPEWFAKVVKAANAVDDKVNDAAAQVKAKVQ